MVTNAKSLPHSRAIIWIGVTLFIFYCAAFFPGYLTADSIVMLKYALGLRSESNWHPPVAVAIWRNLYFVLQHIELIWMAQIALLVTACWWIARSFRATSAAIITSPLLLMFPPLLANYPALWKDCWAILFTLITYAALRHYILYRQLISILLLLLSAALAAGVRIDYLVIVGVFVLIFALFQFLSKPRKQPTKALLSLMAFVSLSIGLQSCANREVQIHLNPWLTVAIWDMAGIVKQGGHVDFPAYLQALDNLNPLLQERYNCVSSDPLVFAPGALPFNVKRNGPHVDPQAEESLKPAWIHAIVGNPAAYLSHRLCVAKQFFGLPGTEIHYPYAYNTSANVFGIHFDPSTLAQILLDNFYQLQQGWMFRYWIYIPAAVIVAAFILLCGGNSWLASALLLSIFASAARVMILPATDFRYGLWIITGTLLLVLELIETLFKPKAISKLASLPTETIQ